MLDCAQFGILGAGSLVIGLGEQRVLRNKVALKFRGRFLKRLPLWCEFSPIGHEDWVFNTGALVVGTHVTAPGSNVISVGWVLPRDLF